MAYVVQAALGGHSIPIDAGTMAVLRVLDLVTDKDVAAGVVPGLERAVAKSKGVEFGSLLHELGADYSANPYSPPVREILLQIDPECESRLPKRRADRSAAEAAEPAEPAKEPDKAAEGSRRGKQPPASRRPAAAARSRRAKKKAAAGRAAAPRGTAGRRSRPSRPAERHSPRTAAPPRSGRPRRDSPSASRGENRRMTSDER